MVKNILLLISIVLLLPHGRSVAKERDLRRGEVAAIKAATAVVPPPAAKVVLAPQFTTPLSIDECLSYALAHSPELKRLSLSYADQLLQVIIEHAAFDFGINGSVNRRIDTDINTSQISLTKELPEGTRVTLSGTAVDQDPLNDQNLDTATGSITLSKTILGGGSWTEVRSGIDTSLIDKAIRLNSFEKRKRQLVYEIKAQYYRVLRALKTIPLEENRLARSQKNLEHAIEREEPLDIANAKVQVPQDELSLLRARAGVESAFYELKRRMGVDVSMAMSIDVALDFEDSPIALEDDLIHALGNHEDIINARLTLKKLEIDHRISKSKVWPAVSIDGTYSKSSEDGINLSGVSDRRVGLSFDWDFGSRSQRAKRDRQKNALRDQNLQLFIIEQRIEQNLRNLAREIDVARRGIELKKKAVEVAALRLELFKDRWDNGEIGILEYVRSQNDLENAKVSLLNERANFLELLAQYRFQAALKDTNV